MGNSNFLIEGAPEMVGNLVNDTVIERNVTVEEELNVKLVFIPNDAGQMDVAADIQKYKSVNKLLNKLVKEFESKNVTK